MSPTGLSPSLARLSRPLRLYPSLVTPRPCPGRALFFPSTPATQRPRAWHVTGLGCSLFARRYWGNRGCFLFLGVLRCFSSPGSPPQLRILEVCSSGLPHSGIPGSTLAYSYPELIAVSHALHRLPAPRHPPYALCILTANFLVGYDAHIRWSIPDQPYSLFKVLGKTAICIVLCGIK